MSHHPPTRGAADHRKTSIAAFELELLQEKASALGRLGRRLEASLKALADFDASSSGRLPAAGEPGVRDILVAAAAEAFWNLLVQREACGFLDGQAVLEDYQVPADVHRRAGVGPLTRPRGRPHWPRR